MLKLIVYSSRRPDVAADEIVLGLINGGLCGGGISIEHRDKGKMAFRCNAPLMEAVPDHGQIELTQGSDGRTKVELTFATTNLMLRASMWGMLFGLVAAAQLWWVGWIPAVAAAVGLLLVIGTIQWSREVRRLRNRARGYVENLRFIKYQ